MYCLPSCYSSIHICNAIVSEDLSRTTLHCSYITLYGSDVLSIVVTVEWTVLYTV